MFCPEPTGNGKFPQGFLQKLTELLLQESSFWVPNKNFSRENPDDKAGQNKEEIIETEKQQEDKDNDQ